MLWPVMNIESLLTNVHDRNSPFIAAVLATLTTVSKSSAFMSRILMALSFIGSLQSDAYGFALFLFALSCDQPFVLGDRRRHRLADNPRHRPKLGRADLQAGAALDAFVLIDDVDSVLAAVDRLCRTSPETRHAGLALIRIDVVRGDVAKEAVDLLAGEQPVIVRLVRKTGPQLLPFRYLDVRDQPCDFLNFGPQHILIDAFADADRP